MSLGLPFGVTQTSRRFLSLAARESQRAIIFDKDGTLVDVHAQWVPWIRELVARIEVEAGLSISARAYTSLGFDDEAGKVGPGILGEGTMAMVHDCLAEIVSEEGTLARPAARALVVRASQEAAPGGQRGATAAVETIQPLGDTPALFARLRAAGFRIAVNTSDGRAATRRALDQLGVAGLVDAVVCGDDDWVLAKPHPVSAYSVCAQLGVRPRDVVIIGDSLSDLQLGTNAQLGCAIGVLSGITPKHALQAHADHVAEDVTEAVELILRNQGPISPNLS